ncbi:MAG TPA: N-acetylmuramoyl-L-alanine amidase [Azospirillaceae bacterium]|nr:N-acetylmuramoyl-L-alanine amidase [Azospirillaceae bacterium]
MLRVAVGVPLLGFGGLFPAGAASAAVREAAAPAAKGAPRKAPPPRLVMIDPGHGGKDPGTIGASGLMEKDVTLDIAKELARQLGRAKGVTARLTRDTDVFLSLKERVEIARAAKADLFISVHADSAPNARARGLSAYTLSEKASDEFAQALAQQENLADGLGVDLKHTDAEVAAILLDLAARHTMTAALAAKQSIIQGAGRDLALLDNPMRSANFAVLKAPDVPSVLVETGFLSNRQDEAQLRDAAKRRRIAGVLAREVSALISAAPFV